MRPTAVLIGLEGKEVKRFEFDGDSYRVFTHEGLNYYFGVANTGGEVFFYAIPSRQALEQKKGQP